jgi:hypothetical protein
MYCKEKHTGGSFTIEAHLTLCHVVVVQIHVPTPASLAQSAEHQTFNLRVAGSSPARGYSPRYD